MSWWTMTYEKYRKHFFEVKVPEKPDGGLFIKRRGVASQYISR